MHTCCRLSLLIDSGRICIFLMESDTLNTTCTRKTLLILYWDYSLQSSNILKTNKHDNLWKFGYSLNWQFFCLTWLFTNNVLQISFKQNSCTCVVGLQLDGAWFEVSLYWKLKDFTTAWPTYGARLAASFMYTWLQRMQISLLGSMRIVRRRQRCTAAPGRAR